jgi:hypothetical protein
MPGCVDRLAAGAKVSKKARARLTADAPASDQLGYEHATYVVTVAAASPRNEHTLWIPENGRRRFGHLGSLPLRYCRSKFHQAGTFRQLADGRYVALPHARQLTGDISVLL